jgi:hypothetical protein
MLAARNNSFIRRPNGRVLFAALLLSCVGYYTGRLSKSSRWTTPKNQVPSAPWPSLLEERVTVTVQAPQATVTVTNEVIVPKDVIPEEPLILNGPPTPAFQGMLYALDQREETVYRCTDNLRPEVNYITTWPGSGFSEPFLLLHSARLTISSSQRCHVIRMLCWFSAQSNCSPLCR